VPVARGWSGSCSQTSISTERAALRTRSVTARAMQWPASTRGTCRDDDFDEVHGINVRDGGDLRIDGHGFGRA